MSGRRLRIGFVGAGGVNFGTIEGPWDHATRIESLRDLAEVVSLTDMDVARARAVVDKRIAKKGKIGEEWKNCKIYSSLDDMLKTEKLDIIWIGLPPSAHGGLAPSKNYELRCAAAGVSMFIEKPLSVEPPEQVAAVGVALKKANVLTSVGYMMRHLKAVAHMKQLLKKHGLPVCTVMARYNSAYTAIAKPFWWDNNHSGGPVVEQATHFCDLARFFGGDVDLSTVQAYCIPANEPLGNLKKIPADPFTGLMKESQNPDKFQEQPLLYGFCLGCSYMQIWKFKNGALGSLSHAALLHDTRYASEFEVWADGLLMTLVDPYSECKLLGDDPYLTEDKSFLEAVLANDPHRVLSSYEDAVKTYELTWAIRRAGEKSVNTRKAKL